jgi:hypothetical protein
MPKTLILFSSRSDGTTAYVDAIAEGARSVRFSEVEVRRVDLALPDAADASLASIRYQTLGSADELQAYDAIIALDASATLTNLLKAGGPQMNRVGAAFASPSTGGGPDDAPVWATMKTMAGLDMILVPPAADAELAAAMQLGKRVAEVTSWITHARSHHHAH